MKFAKVWVLGILVMTFIAVVFFPAKVNHHVGFTLIPGGYACGPGFTSCSFGSESGGAPVPVIVKPGTPDGNYPGPSTTVQGGNAPSDSAAPEPGGECNLDVGQSSQDAGNANMHVGENAADLFLGSDAGEVDVMGTLRCNAGAVGCGASVYWIVDDPPTRPFQRTVIWGCDATNQCSSNWSLGWTTAFGSSGGGCLGKGPVDGGPLGVCDTCTCTSCTSNTSLAGWDSPGFATQQPIYLQAGPRREVIIRNDTSASNEIVWANADFSAGALTGLCSGRDGQKNLPASQCGLSYVGFRCSQNGGDGGIPETTWHACAGNGTNDFCVDTGVSTGCGPSPITTVILGKDCSASTFTQASCNFLINDQVVVSGMTTDMPSPQTALGPVTAAYPAYEDGGSTLKMSVCSYIDRQN